MQTKICSKCKIEKEINEFYRINVSTHKDGLYPSCKLCKKKVTKKWAENNKEKERIRKRKYYLNNKEKNKERDKKYRDRNKEEIIKKDRIRSKKYYQQNKKEISIRHKEYYQQNKKKTNDYLKSYNKNKRKTDLNFKLKNNLRTRIWNVLNGISKSVSTMKLLGCTVKELRAHLESQFAEGMNWDNYSYKGWHIDHIIPCASFDLTDKKQQKICFNYKNLQPLWAKDNLKKGAKIL